MHTYDLTAYNVTEVKTLPLFISYALVVWLLNDYSCSPTVLLSFGIYNHQFSGESDAMLGQMYIISAFIPCKVSGNERF